MFTCVWDFFSGAYDFILGKKKPSQKRRLEDNSDYQPAKQMRLENMEPSDWLACRDYKVPFESTKNYSHDEDEFYNVENQPTKWGSPSTMARKPIKAQAHSGSSFSPGKFKMSANSQLETTQKDRRETFALVNSNHENIRKNNAIGAVRKKSEAPSKVTDKIFESYRPSTKQNGLHKTRALYAVRMKKRIGVLHECYRLKEKDQYKQLLSSIASGTLNKIVLPLRSFKPSIPLIDLTKDKVPVDRSHENIPWTASAHRTNDSDWEVEITKDRRSISKAQSFHDVLTTPKSEGHIRDKIQTVTRVNSLDRQLKTNPVTSPDFVNDMLSNHSKKSSELWKEVRSEEKIVQILHESNLRIHAEVIEDRMKRYLRVTEPALDETEEEARAYMLPDLTKAQEDKISGAWEPASPAQILVEKFGLQMKRRDILTLKGLTWLNDEVINFYMNLIMERGKCENMPNVYAFNTFFYPKLRNSGHSSLKRWTKKVDIFSYDMVFVPIHLGMHWCMTMINFRDKEIRYYDSMGTPNNKCLHSILSYLEDESLDKKKQKYDTSDWELINVDDIPQQMNGSDCGVFACQFAEHLARDCPLLFTQEDMPYFRRKMVLEIIEGNLIT